jgi:hypothetical protein
MRCARGQGVCERVFASGGFGCTWRQSPVDPKLPGCSPLRPPSSYLTTPWTLFTWTPATTSELGHRGAGPNRGVRGACASGANIQAFGECGGSGSLVHDPNPQNPACFSTASCGVKEDLQLYWPKLRPGGIMAGSNFITAEMVRAASGGTGQRVLSLDDAPPFPTLFSGPPKSGWSGPPIALPSTPVHTGLPECAPSTTQRPCCRWHHRPTALKTGPFVRVSYFIAHAPCSVSVCCACPSRGQGVAFGAPSVSPPQARPCTANSSPKQHTDTQTPNPPITDGSRHRGAVRGAAEEFAAEKGIELVATTDSPPTFVIVKPCLLGPLEGQ